MILNDSGAHSQTVLKFGRLMHHETT